MAVPRHQSHSFSTANQQIMELEDLEEQDLVFLAAIPAYTEAGKRKNKNLSFETGDTEAPDYDFDLAYGMRQPEEESQSKEPIIRLKEEDYDDHVNKKTEVPVPTKPPRENQKRLIIIGLVCLLLVIGIAVGVAVGVTTAGGGSTEREITGSDDTGSDTTGSDTTGSSDDTGSDTTGGSTDKTSAPAPSPTAPSPTAPSPIPPSSIVRTPFEKVADGLYLFGDNIPTDESTPEYKAINFLAQEDSGKELDSFRLGQRYALANMFYALGGPNWNNDLGFLSKEHECDWRALDNNLIKGVICEEGDGRVNYISIRKLLVFFRFVCPVIVFFGRKKTYYYDHKQLNSHCTVSIHSK